MANLTYLVTEGQRLVEDALEHRTADYDARCDFAVLGGRLFVLTNINQESKQERRHSIRSWVATIIGIIAVWAIIKGWFIEAFLILKGWFS
jgi:hypothetical protein